jgi:hypothetical protein
MSAFERNVGRDMALTLIGQRNNQRAAPAAYDLK